MDLDKNQGKDKKMAKKKKQRYSGVVYSTDPSFEYEASEQESSETLENHLQQLVVCLDKKARKGKQVTLVQGFVGDGEDLRRLSSLLK